MDQVDEAIEKKERHLEELPGDDKMHLSALKGLRDELQTVINEYNTEGKVTTHSKDTVRRRQNALLKNRGIPTLQRIEALLPQLQSSEAKDIAHQQMGVIAMETKAIYEAGRSRVLNRAFNNLALTIRSNIYGPAPASPEPEVRHIQNKPRTVETGLQMTPAPAVSILVDPAANSPAPTNAHLTQQSANGVDVAQILDLKEIVKHPEYERFRARTVQELKEEISRLLTSPPDKKEDAERLKNVIMIISILKQRNTLSKKKLARLMSHLDERFEKQI
jgi:hypothetical protein